MMICKGGRLFANAQLMWHTLSAALQPGIRAALNKQSD
jgi:hypothetical protein